MKHFISDTHFGDAGIITYCQRPFENVGEMNATIVENWNKVVMENDTVFHLGDVAHSHIKYDELKALLHCLRGYKILILGNHDKGEDPIDYWNGIGFNEVYAYPIVFEKYFVLSHEPHTMTMSAPIVNIYGHVHNNDMYRDVSAHSFNACVERIGYQPIAFDAVKEKVKAAAAAMPCPIHYNEEINS